jgi:hypothetical protein
MLCERAIGLVRGRRIEDANRSMIEALDYEGLISSHAQEEAVTCIRHFAAVRDSLLHTYPWVFARRSAALAELSTPVNGWRFSYVLPADCMRALNLVWRKRTIAEWEQVGTAVGCEYKPVTARYTARITDTGQWAPLFCDAFCAKLAMEINVAVNGEFGIVPTLQQLAQNAVAEGYRVGIITDITPIELHSYRWDSYSNDLSREYLGGVGRQI